MNLRPINPNFAASAAPAAGAGERPAISLQQLECLFANIRARTSWNVDGELLWSYYFFDTSRERLGALGGHLTAEGYNPIGIHPVGQGLLRLHVERIEHHTPDSLHRRNAEFHRLAEACGVGSYDGMEVAPLQ